MRKFEAVRVGRHCKTAGLPRRASLPAYAAGDKLCHELREFVEGGPVDRLVLSKASIFAKSSPSHGENRGSSPLGSAN